MPPQKLPPDTWQIADGRRVKIREMVDDHLLNTLKMIEENPRMYENRADQYIEMLEEARWRKLR